MATLAALAAQQRAERARLEADAAARLVTAYGRAWDAISRDLAALTRAIESAQRPLRDVLAGIEAVAAD